MSEPKKETVRIVLPPRREGQPLSSTPRETAMINLPPKPVPASADAPPAPPAMPAPPAGLQPPSAPGVPKPPSFPGASGAGDEPVTIHGAQRESHWRLGEHLPVTGRHAEQNRVALK